MKEKNKRFKRLVLVMVLLGVSLGYALLNATLTINGNSKITQQSWDIHWNNVQVTNGSVSIGTGDKAAVITPNDNTEVTYEVTLSKPGDFYEFTVDAVNGGSVDGMIDEIRSTYKIGNGNVTTITSSNLPAYLDYSVAYSDGTELSQYLELKAGTTETYKVRVEFKRDIDENDLPDTLQSIVFGFAVDYVQADSNAIDAHPQPSGIRINNTEEISNIATSLNISEGMIYDVMRITSPAYVRGQSWVANEDQLGLYKMSYNYRIKMLTVKKNNSTYEQVDLSVDAQCNKKADNNPIQTADWIDYDYPEYEDGGGDYETCTIYLSQSNLESVDGEVYVLLIPGAENYPGLSKQQIGQYELSYITTNKLRIVNSFDEISLNRISMITMSEQTIGQNKIGEDFYRTFTHANTATGASFPIIRNLYDKNNKILESYVVFMNQGGYSFELRGGIDESSKTNKNVFNDNKEELLKIFDLNECTETVNRIQCTNSNISAYAEVNGNVGSTKATRTCTINSNGVSKCETT